MSHSLQTPGIVFKTMDAAGSRLLGFEAWPCGMTLGKLLNLPVTQFSSSV